MATSTATAGNAASQDEPQVPDSHARQEEQPERQGEQGEAVAEVGLEQHEAGQSSRHQQRRHEPPPELAELLAAPRQERGQIDDQGELGQLDRLEGHRPEPEPATSPVDRLAEGRHENEYQQRDGHDQRRHHESLQTPVVDPQRHPQGHPAQHRPEELLLEEDERVVKTLGGHDGAGRVHHHDAHGEQDHRGAEEPHVGTQPPRHLLELGGSERRSSPRPPHRFRTPRFMRSLRLDPPPLPI